MNNALIERYNWNDYRVWWEMDIPSPRNDFFETPIQLNQFWYDNWGCWYFASTWALADLLGLTKKQAWDVIEKSDQLKEEYWYTKGVGMYMYRAVDLVRNVANDKFSYDISSYRVKTGSKEFYNLLDMWYSLLTWYRWNQEYEEDIEDWVLNWKNFGYIYWHMIRIIQKDWDIYVVDNRKDSQYNIDDIQQESKDNKNIYKVKHLKDLIENDVFFKNAYIYIVKDDIMTQLQQDVADVQYALDNGITNDTQQLEDVKNGNYTQAVQSTMKSSRIHQDLSSKINKILDAIESIWS